MDRQSFDDAVCLVGLGYVGLPLAVAFDQKGFDVIGFDVDPTQVETLQANEDPTETVGNDAVAESDVEFTVEPDEIERADQVIVAVPTPITEDRDPDLTYIRSAGRTVGRHISPDTTVVLESTVYPGLTREELVPVLEEASGMTAGEEFSVGYSPERATTGDTEHGLSDVVKVISAFDEDVLDELEALYGSIVDAGVYRAPSVEAAEAAKVVENIQRDVNIALMNELAMAFDHLDVDTQDVLETASTKWNFHDYSPGLVGGHCIPVDPHYLIDRVEREGFTPNLLRTSREVNRTVDDHILTMTSEALDEVGKDLEDARVLALGLTYKPNVADIRSTPIAEVIAGLKERGATVVGHDPHAPDDQITEEFDIDTIDHPTFKGFDAAVVLTPHSAYETIDPGDAAYRMRGDPVLVDVQGVFDRSEVTDLPLTYRSL